MRALVIFLILTSAAFAQTNTTNSPKELQIDKAHRQCKPYRLPDETGWRPGWESCAEIERAWNNTQTGQLVKKRDELREQQRKEIESLAKSLAKEGEKK